MKDPVSTLAENFPYDPGKILASSRGAAYVAIMLANGRIGVCSTLNTVVQTDPLLLTRPDLTKADHRILVTAFANAHINYLPEDPAPGDIFDQIDFTGKENTVMIGYFPPLVQKFRDKGIRLSVFDRQQDYPDLTPASQLAEKLAGSDGVIVTATTLINQTFPELISGIRPGTGIYLLGPSTPLYPAFLQEYGINRLFGMIFRPYDFEILEIIGQGLGTQSFSKKSKKISL